MHKILCKICPPYILTLFQHTVFHGQVCSSPPMKTPRWTHSTSRWVLHSNQYAHIHVLLIGAGWQKCHVQGFEECTSVRDDWVGGGSLSFHEQSSWKLVNNMTYESVIFLIRIWTDKTKENHNGLVYVLAPQLSFSQKCNSFRELIILPQCSTLLHILMVYQLSSDESKEQPILSTLTPPNIFLFFLFGVL